MNRLTEINKDACDLCNLDCKHMDNSCEKAKLYNKLSHYEDFEEQGRLIELPCKVGDTVYVIDHEYEDIYVPSSKYYLVLEHEFELYMITGLGTWVFPTKAEADAKLAELSGDAR